MRFSIELSKEAVDDIDALYQSDRRLFNRIIKKMDFLEENACEGKPLVGNHKGEFSIRLGDYRIVYEIDPSNHIIYILTVKHRRHVYK